MTKAMDPRDRIIPWYFVMFFVVIACMNAVMVTLAVRTHSGLVTEHPYEKGLAYNSVVQADAEQLALGWSSTIRYADGALVFNLTDRHHRPLPFTHANATLTRPTSSGMDFEVPLTGKTTPVTFPASGLWHVQVDVTQAGHHYQATQRIVVP
jgi:nitrogen fixation protein FixH